MSKFQIYNFLGEEGIELNTYPPYVHELNGTAERYNRSLMHMSRCLLAETEVQKQFWPEAFMTAVYLKNRAIAHTIENKTAYDSEFM